MNRRRFLSSLALALAALQLRLRPEPAPAVAFTDAERAFLYATMIDRADLELYRSIVWYEKKTEAKPWAA